MNTLAVQRVKEFLKAHPSITWIEEDGKISVEPKDETGFRVWLQKRNGGEIVVGYDAWHEHFEDVDEALKCFHHGLTDNCRMVVKQRGSFRYWYLVQYLAEGEWIDGWITGWILFPFWRRKKVIYLQNKWLSWP